MVSSSLSASESCWARVRASSSKRRISARRLSAVSQSESPRRIVSRSRLRVASRAVMASPPFGSDACEVCGASASSRSSSSAIARYASSAIGSTAADSTRSGISASSSRRISALASASKASAAALSSRASAVFISSSSRVISAFVLWPSVWIWLRRSFFDSSKRRRLSRCISSGSGCRQCGHTPSPV